MVNNIFIHDELPYADSVCLHVAVNRHKAPKDGDFSYIPGQLGTKKCISQ